MMENKWHVGLGAINTGVIEIGDENGQRVCVLNQMDYAGRIAVMFPRANLIAAAPELLEALKVILDDLKKQQNELPAIPAVCELWAQGAAAIAKAEGRA